MKIFISALVLSLITLIPLGIKWELEKKTIIPAALLIGIASGSVVNGFDVFRDLAFYHTLILEIFLIGGMSLALLLWKFYRDPVRVPPEDDNAILSPADGRIIYVKKIEDGKIPLSEKGGRTFPLSDFIQANVVQSGGHLVGITMNYLDVHVNRAPIGGRITLLKHIKGLFISLKKKEAVIQNERLLTVIENGHLKVGIVQIASRMVRKIIPYFREGNEVKSGERMGAIRFGSQVDVILPDLPSLSIQVSPGEKVKAGISILATIEEREAKSL